MRIYTEKEIGTAILIGIKRKDINQKRLSEIMKVSPPVVGRWVKGDTLPTGSKLVTIIKFLEIEDLLFNTDRIEHDSGFGKNDYYNAQFDVRILDNKKLLDKINNEIEMIKSSYNEKRIENIEEKLNETIKKVDFVYDMFTKLFEKEVKKNQDKNEDY